MSDRFLDVAVQAARKAGDLIKGRLGSLAENEIAAKDTADFVTAVDRASEEIIVSTIQGFFPDHGFLAEENHATSDPQGHRWIIDPLDGTTNFIHQFPQFAVSIALQIDGVTVLGVVLDPSRGELFSGQRGKGAQLNGKPIAVTTEPAQGRGLVATGFPFRSKGHIDTYLRAFKEVFLSTGDLRRAGSAALDLAYVAAGRVDGFFELGLAAWDMAAGALLIEEAGGVVTDFGGGGDYLVTGNILAGGRGMHGKLLEITRGAFRGNLDR